MVSPRAGFGRSGGTEEYQNDWSGLEVDYIHKYGEQNYIQGVPGGM